MAGVIVIIGGKRYTDFTEVTFTRDKEDLTCSGSLKLSWPGAEQFNAQSPPAQEMKDGAKGEIWLDDQKAGTFRIDKRSGAGSSEKYELTLTFRGLAGALVDSSADHPSGQENKRKPGDIAKKLAEGYESKIIDKSGEDRPLERYVLREGETVARAIRTATREFGLIASENEDGDVEIRKRDADEGSGPDLVIGDDFTEWTVGRDISPRASKVKAKGASIATDKKYGKDAEELAGSALDLYVEYKKEKHVNVDGDQDHKTLKTRALAEAKRRAASGLTVALTMAGFSDRTGKLWKVGRLHRVKIPVELLDEQLQIKSVEFSLDSESRKATVNLVPKEAFSADPDKKKADTGKAKAGKAKDKVGSGGPVNDLYNLNDIKSE